MAVRSLSTSTIGNNQPRFGNMGLGFPGSGGDHEGEHDGFYYHVFTSSGTFTVARDTYMDYLVIGGGGGTGASTSQNVHGGGGGAGGLVVGSGLISAGSYSMVIGAGGIGAVQNTLIEVGPNGDDTVFTGVVTAKGGGGGNSSNASTADPAADGGSGGGSGGGSTRGARLAGNAISAFTINDYDQIGAQGHGGGRGGTNIGGGGGGAGGAGHAGGTNGVWALDSANGIFWGNLSSGGFGKRLDEWGIAATAVAGTTIGDPYTYTDVDGVTSRTMYFFASGGTGAPGTSALFRGRVPGGGGAGSSGTPTSTEVNAVANTGGGGGGARGGSASNTGGSGGSGLIIVRYAV